jgi:hypothetical protein
VEYVFEETQNLVKTLLAVKTVNIFNSRKWKTHCKNSSCRNHVLELRKQNRKKYTSPELKVKLPRKDLKKKWDFHDSQEWTLDY